MSSKIKIKVGQIEVEFEGSEEFLSKELPHLLKNVSSLYVSMPPPGDAGQLQPAPHSGAPIQMTTNSIAAKLGVKSGSDLITAAAAHLTLAKRAPIFSRQQLLKEMQSASSYYKKNYSANLSKYLKTAIDDGTIVENAANVFALGAKTKTDLEAKLAR